MSCVDGEDGSHQEMGSMGAGEGGGVPGGPGANPGYRCGWGAGGLGEG